MTAPRFGPTPDAVLADATWTGPTAVCVPDATRPLHPGPALEALRPRIQGDLRVIVGLGLHRAMTAPERTRLARWSPIEHDPDDVVPTATVDGIEGTIFSEVARCRQAIGVGVVELHQYAGVSGGHKAVSVGCGGRRTISALHARARVLAPGVQVGRLDGNPFRAAVDALGEAAGCTHALVWIPDLAEWGFGEPRSLVAASARRLQPWSAVHRLYDSVRIHVPEAKGRTLYQASRAATYLTASPAPPLKPGARIQLVAALDEGLGHEAGFRAALHRTPPPWGELLHGPPPTGAGAQRAVMLALLARSYHLELVGCIDPAPFLRVGIDATSALPSDEDDQLVVPMPFSRLPQLTR